MLMSEKNEQRTGSTEFESHITFHDGPMICTVVRR